MFSCFCFRPPAESACDSAAEGAVGAVGEQGDLRLAAQGVNATPSAHDEARRMVALNALVLEETQSLLDGCSRLNPTPPPPRWALDEKQEAVRAAAVDEALARRPAVLARLRRELDRARALNVIGGDAVQARLHGRWLFGELVRLRQSLRYDPLVNPWQSRWLASRTTCLHHELAAVVKAPDAALQRELAERFQDPDHFRDPDHFPEPDRSLRARWEGALTAMALICDPMSIGPAQDYLDLERALDALQADVVSVRRIDGWGQALLRDVKELAAEAARRGMPDQRLAMCVESVVAMGQHLERGDLASAEATGDYLHQLLHGRRPLPGVASVPRATQLQRELSDAAGRLEEQCARWSDDVSRTVREMAHDLLERAQRSLPDVSPPLGDEPDALRARMNALQAVMTGAAPAP